MVSAFFCVFLFNFFCLFDEVYVFLFFLFVGNIIGGGVLAGNGLFGGCLFCFFGDCI